MSRLSPARCTVVAVPILGLVLLASATTATADASTVRPAASSSSGGVTIDTGSARGLAVGNVKVTVKIQYGGVGHFNILDSQAGYSVNTPDASYQGGYCTSGSCVPATYSHTFPVNRSFPNGSHLCASFYLKKSGGGYQNLGNPCLTIHS